jgi:uncharacterized protein (TIGR03435 family)
MLPAVQAQAGGSRVILSGWVDSDGNIRGFGKGPSTCNGSPTVGFAGIDGSWSKGWCVMVKSRLLGAVGIVAIVGGGLVAQTPANTAFEAASIKPSNASGRGTTMGVQPGRYTATNVTLRALIVNAYSLESLQLSGGPTWISSDHFDIVAKMPGGSGAPPDSTQSRPMLRELLADRFKLAMHRETRELPIYALVSARSDKKLGPQIHPTTIDCEPLAAQSTLKEKEGKDKSKEQLGGAPATPRARGQKPPCAMTMEPGRMSASGMTMAAIASSLSGSVQRTVLDRTSIPGAFDVKLTWTPDQMPQADGNPTKNKGTKIDPNGPPIFTALQEQLGLKLESAKGPVDVLVIDHVEHPTED